jgi:dUTP pyrophosphatase
VQLKVKRTDPAAILPSFAYPGDAGVDLTTIKGGIIEPHTGRDLPTGLRVELPEGYWARITGRSSTLRKRGLLVNEGIIDGGYRGELFVYVYNPNGSPVPIESGARLAQLILAPIVMPEVVEVDELTASLRGENGFGSSGLVGGVQSWQTYVGPYGSGGDDR